MGIKWMFTMLGYKIIRKNDPRVGWKRSVEDNEYVRAIIQYAFRHDRSDLAICARLESELIGLDAQGKLELSNDLNQTVGVIYKFWNAFHQSRDDCLSGWCQL